MIENNQPMLNWNSLEREYRTISGDCVVIKSYGGSDKTGYFFEGLAIIEENPNEFFTYIIKYTEEGIAKDRMCFKPENRKGCRFLKKSVEVLTLVCEQQFFYDYFKR